MTDEEQLQPICSLMGGDDGMEESNMTPVNLGHHTGTLRDGAHPWSRDLDKRR